jgi:flagellar hook-associated protein 2
MATITAAGVGSGLDINSIISQLMAIEQRPLVAMQNTEKTYQAQLSAYGRLHSAMAGFQSAMSGLADLSKFEVFAANSSNTDVLAASADSTASLGSYQVQVVRIAEAHKMASANTFTDTDTTTLGAAGDTMTITVGTQAFTVAIGGKTLGAIRDAINQASDNTGATATIIQDNSGYRLLLKANDTGSTHALTVTYSGTDPLNLQTLNADRDGSGSFTPADLNASLVLEGAYPVTRSSNTVSDVIQGVTLNLKAAGTVSLEVVHDVGAIQAAVESFVKAYNDLHATVRDLRNSDLQGDNSLLSLENQIQDVLNTAPAGLASAYQYLSSVGVSLQKDGTMALDSTALVNALNTDFTGVAQLFANNDQGYVFRLKAVADSILGVNGLIDSRTQGLNARIEMLDDRMAQMQQRLSMVEAGYRAQFSALDALVGQLRATSDFLSRQLTLPAQK